MELALWLKILIGLGCTALVVLIVAAVLGTLLIVRVINSMGEI